MSDTTNETAPDADLGQEEVAERIAQEQAQGYVGTVTDPTPNENYTLAGVTSGAPTPETDADAYAAALEAAGHKGTKMAASKAATDAAKSKR